MKFLTSQDGTLSLIASVKGRENSIRQKTPAKKHQINAFQTLNSITYEGRTQKCTLFEMEKTQLKQIHKFPFDTVQFNGISRPNTYYTKQGKYINIQIKLKRSIKTVKTSSNKKLSTYESPKYM